MILIYLVAGWVLGIVAAWFLKLSVPAATCRPFTDAVWLDGLVAANVREHFCTTTAAWLLLFLIPLGYLVLFWRDPALRKWHVILIFFVLGAIYFQWRQPAATDLALAQLNEQGRASLIGIVVADPDVRQTQTLLHVQVSKIQTGGDWRATQGLALVAAPRDTPIEYGDEVQVDGAPLTPPDGADFSYRDYLARENVFTLIQYAQVYPISSGHGERLWAAIYQFRAAAQRAINQLVPEPAAALLSGILLGNARGLPADLRQAFADTNTAHIIAISG